MEYKRITVFAGHFGSGKTNLSVNFAMDLKAKGFDATLCDLDIVNPYFRSKDSEHMLKKHGIPVIASKFANTNVDVPAINPESYSIFRRNNKDSFVIDLGGDDRGAYALGRFSEYFEGIDSYDMILVINMYRPDTSSPEGVLEVLKEIEGACRVSFTGIANNSNIGKATKRQHVAASIKYAKMVTKLTGLELKMTSYKSDIDGTGFPNPYPIEIYTKEIWDVN